MRGDRVAELPIEAGDVRSSRPSHAPPPYSSAAPRTLLVSGDAAIRKLPQVDRRRRAERIVMPSDGDPAGALVKLDIGEAAAAHLARTLVLAVRAHEVGQRVAMLDGLVHISASLVEVFEDVVQAARAPDPGALAAAEGP